MKKLIIFITIAIVVGVVIVLICNRTVNKKSSAYLYSDVQSIPYNKAGLLLGTSKYLKDSTINEYFANRIVAAVELYKNKKISYIVVSGDNGKDTYNEPEDMKNELVAQGVPDSAIYLDYAGFRTFDSMIRMSKIFGQDSFTVISQKFHNQRAVYIALTNGLNACGYNAADVNAYKGFKTNLREKFARVKLFLDIAFGKQPKFLGDPVELP